MITSMHNQTTTQSISLASPQPQMINGVKYRWNVHPLDETVVRNIAYKHNISLPVAHVLAQRGYTDHDRIRSFLFSSLENDVHHGILMKGMEIAAQRILRAIKHKEKILIFGDYDVDGVTSTSLALTALLPLGADINFFLPNRVKDGYGLSEKAVNLAHKNGYSLIITVDNGIAAFAPAERAQKLGIDLIITDHHRSHDHVPPALSIINPNQHDCAYPFKSLAGVGVTFKLVSVLYEMLGIKKMPDKVYELLMLGTIADVVPLLGENRYWVRHGLHLVNEFKSNALQTLASNSNLTKEMYNSLDIGFMIAPQINALGRLADAREAVKFMISSDKSEVERIGNILKAINEERKRVDRSIYEEIEQSITNKTIDLSQEHIIIAANNGWPAGVIGLVAGKLMHNYGRPAILFHLDEHGIAKGSCRSIPEFNIFDALTASNDILLQFGGHSFAAGLKLEQKNIPLLKKRITERLAQQMSLEELQPKITIDAPLKLTDINHNLMSDLEQLEPFGNQNPQPIFYVSNVSLLKPPQLLKEKHVKCMVFADGVIKPLVFFNRPDLVNILLAQKDQPFSITCHVIENAWSGVKKFELQGLDIATESQ